MNETLGFGLICFAFGLTLGLWLGFKLWRQTYVQIEDQRRRWL